MYKNWKILLCVSLTVIVLFDFARAQSAESKDTKQVTCTGKIIDEQGRPIADVKVSLHEMVYDETTYIYDPKLLGEAQTGTDGAFSFEETVKDNQYRYGYIVSEKEGLALGFDNWSMRDGDKELEIKLGPSKELSGIVVDDKDMPVSDAQVLLSMLVLGEGRERKNLNSLVIPKLLTANTDAMGQFTFTRIAAEATAEFIVTKPGRATVNTYKRTGESYQKLNFTEGQKDIKLLLPAEAKIEGIVVEKSTGKPVGGVQLRFASGQEIGYFRPKPLITKADGTFSISTLSATQYILELVQSSDKLSEWVAERLEVITEAGKTKSGIKIELSKGGVLEVKVIDAVNKEPVEQAYVIVNNQINNRSASSRSDEDGLARMRLMPGDYQLTYINKQGYSRQRLQDTVTIEDGKTERLEYELIGIPKITGIVRDEKGKPIEGVELHVCPMGRETSTSDTEGKFEVIFDPGDWPGSRNRAMFLIGRQEERNLAGAVQVDEDTNKLDLTLEPAVTFSGQIVDQSGQGIANADVRVMMHGPGWGSTLRENKRVKTNKEGRYEIKAIPPGHEYSIYTSADGYGNGRGETTSTKNAVDNHLDMGKLTLAVANLSLSGVVVDDNDKPVVGARISCYGESQPHRSAQTDTEGKFTIVKVCAGKMRISASKTGAARLSGSIETEGGATDVRIVISQRSVSTRYEPRRPPSLVSRPLPDLNALGVNLSPSETNSKRILVCFWDMQQRPSRYCVTQLAKQAQQLKDKGVVIVAVQASKMDQASLTQWAKKYKIPFPVGMVQRSFEKARFSWGIRSLPWLILTDTKHLIRSAGFPIKELNEKLKQLDGG